MKYLWEWWRRITEWWHARQRGERRIAPHGTRGRVYAPREGGGPIAGRSEPQATIRARVYRAATGKWEDHGIISTPRKD